MKIWNSYLTYWIDLKKCPVNKATWEHGFLSGFILAYLSVIITLVLVLEIL